MLQKLSFAVILVIFANQLQPIETIDWHRVFINHFTSSRQNRLMPGFENGTKNGLLNGKKLSVKIVNNGLDNSIDGELSNELTAGNYHEPKPINNNRPPQKPPQPQQPTNEQLIISETLVYVVDSLQTLANRYQALEKRIGDLESLHFNITCAKDYIRHGPSCYRFVRSSKRTWASAGEDCDRFDNARGHLLAIDSLAKGQQVIELILRDDKLRGKTFWLNGLNVRIQWIWVHSGQPVQIFSSAANTSNTNEPGLIPGDGNCLALSYDRRNGIYEMRGTPCNFLSFYICEQSFGES